jgi:hypothetical protein
LSGEAAALSDCLAFVYINVVSKNPQGGRVLRPVFVSLTPAEVKNANKNAIGHMITRWQT